MEKNNLKEVINDLKAKRDALSLAHEQLKKDNDDWNKCIIVLSLVTGMIESAKIKMGWDNDAVALIPVVMSSIIASVSALIKFKKFPEQMEILIQSTSLLTNTLNKCRNHDDLDKDILIEYHNALEKLETSVYPDIRKKYLKISHKNLIDIMKIESKYFSNIEMVNQGIKIESDSYNSVKQNNSNNPLNRLSFDKMLNTNKEESELSCVQQDNDFEQIIHQTNDTKQNIQQDNDIEQIIHQTNDTKQNIQQDNDIEQIIHQTNDTKQNIQDNDIEQNIQQDNDIEKNKQQDKNKKKKKKMIMNSHNYMLTVIFHFFYISTTEISV